MADTAISWTDATWNPVTGCTKVSAGCKNCYAERVSKRTFAGQFVRLSDADMDGHEHRPRRFTDVRCHPERLEQPLRWRKPRRVFVNSMSDLFHEDVDDGFLRAVFAVMGSASDHTFQVLTKRPERMREFLACREWRCALAPIEFLATGHRDLIWCGLAPAGTNKGMPREIPANIWLGVSCENQETADQRIPILLDTPAAVRFVSCEPLLGPIEFSDVTHRADGVSQLGKRSLSGIDWVIVGGESGPGFRPMKPEWARSLRDQCKAAGVPYFFKQDSGPRPGMREDLLGEVVQDWPEPREVPS